MTTVHVLIPVFNEEATVRAALERVMEAPLPAGWRPRITVVDDASTDETPAILSTMGSTILVTRHEVNRGKGAALQTGFDVILDDPAIDKDDVVVIQDADLEYDPADFPQLLAPIVRGETRVAFGSRFGRHRSPANLWEWIHTAGNRALTRLSNLATGYRLTDMECGYKAIRLDVLRRIRPSLTEDRFGIEPQITASLASAGERIVEIPVSYAPRSFKEGKKIKWGDGVRALWVISRERLRQGRWRAGRRTTKAVHQDG